MFTQAITESPVNERGDGQVSYLLLAPGQFGSEHLGVTWVDGEPGSQQPLHQHAESEQIYVIVAGSGEMIVDGEERHVDAGTMVFIPAGASHAIRNTSDERLTFISAAAPPFETPMGEFAYGPPPKKG